MNYVLNLSKNEGELRYEIECKYLCWEWGINFEPGF